MSVFVEQLMIPLRVVKIISAYLLDSFRYVAYSNSLRKNVTYGSQETNIIYQYHVLEKGLSMPNRRWNFGHQKIMQLSSECETFIRKYGCASPSVSCAVGVMLQYLAEHDAGGVVVPDVIRSRIISLVSLCDNLKPVAQKYFFRDAYFADFDKPFDIFAFSRSSVRDYDSTPIPSGVILDAIKIAQSSPSACNRQTVKVHIIQDRAMIDKILSFQNGNKGFGHLADKLLIVTYDVSGFRGAQERNFGWLDCGFFAMSLLQSLHFKKIGACPLNTGFSQMDSMRIRRVCGIPKEEELCLFITCGNLPAEFTAARSTRRNISEIARIH